MTDRQFLWGLSGGVAVMAVAGAFWFGLAMSSVLTPGSDWRLWSLWTLLQAGGFAGLLWAAFRLRRRAGFDPAELRGQNEQEHAVMRRLRVRMAWIAAAQAALIALGVWWCVATQAENRLWPWVGFVVSLHFIPLARLFHVRTYYATGLVGSALSLAALAAPGTPHALAWLGGGLCAVMWLTAAYLVRHADRIAAVAAGETWAV